MKKILLILFLTLVSSTYLFSQIGIKAGLNYSKLNSKDFETLSGFQGGVFFHFTLSKIVHLNTGINYSQKGFVKSTFDIYGSLIRKEDIRLNYIEIPLNFAFHLKIGQEISLFAEAGPYLAIGISGDSDKATDYGLNFGLGVEYMTFQLAVNYGLGLNQIVSNYQNRLLFITIAGYFRPTE